MKTPWIVTNEDLTAECLRCGEKLTVATNTGSLSLNVWIAASKAFLKVHRRCREQEC